MIVAKWLYNTICAPPPSREWYLEEYQKLIEKIDALAADSDDPTDFNQHVEESYMPDAVFFRHKGTVTHLYSDGDGRIDDQYTFNREAVPNLRLKVGDKVLCMARKISNDKPLVIYKIDAIEEDSWSSEPLDLIGCTTSNPIPLKTFQKWLRGGIIVKQNGIIVIDTRPNPEKPIKLTIAEIGCTFNPTEGDQVEVETEYGIDQNDPSVYAITGYYGMKAIDQKAITGEITAFKKKMQYGLIDNKYLFYMDVLQHSNNQNCVPNKGDTVTSDVISSHQKIDDQEFFWRCINLVKVRSANRINGGGEGSHLSEKSIEIVDSDDEIDNEICGITLTKNSDLKVTLDATNARKKIELIAVNNSNRSRKISQVKFNNELIASQIECNDLYRYNNIQANGRFIYRIDVVGKIRGVTKLKMDFTIDNKHSIRRCITIDVQNVAEKNITRVTHSKAYTKKIYSDKRDTVKGVKPVDSPHFVDQRMQRFDVPKHLFDESMKSTELYDPGDDYSELFSNLTVQDYARYFQSLLHFEEIFMRHEFRMYDQERGHFIRDGEFLAYQMHKNVFECRPSIVIGDTIYAQDLRQSADSEKEPLQYQGYIHRMKRNRLLLKFADDFHNTYLGEDYRLIFKFSRTKFIKQHNAIDRIGKKMLSTNIELLFPTAIKLEKRLQLDIELIDGDMILAYPRQQIGWFNKKLNAIQRQAVFNVLRGEVKTCPYVVFGPPGTGKTSTLIEMILQLYRKGNSRLVVATPSNSAANLITKLLSECGALKAGEFARIVGQNSIERDQIPEELRIHCMTVDIAAPRSKAEPQNPIENGIRVKCTSDVIGLHRILISTCMTFGSLLSMKFKPGHFTHVIIDEAGQCTEPEIAIPISLLDKNVGQVILAGDPHQLGPVVHSPIAKRCGLAKSLLSRLLDFIPYRPDVGRSGGFDERVVTQLLHNYRSLPSILSTYSNLSYDSKLIANISATDSDEQRLLAKVQQTIHKTSMLKHKENYGVYFIGVNSRNETVPDSTSWRNPQEVVEVITIVHQLFQCGLTEDDIGIITPYTLQVKELRVLADEYFNEKQPKIGSVEEFQGQERNVIIISTVRTSDRHISHDGKYGLGFINNKNRLNVAISRARAILIIIGHPGVLSLDENWRQLILDCYINETYSGCEIPIVIRNEAQEILSAKNLEA